MMAVLGVESRGAPSLTANNVVWDGRTSVVGADIVVLTSGEGTQVWVNLSGARGLKTLAEAASPEAYRVLSRLADTGAVAFAELDEELRGWEDWIAVAQIIRAGYASVGVRH